MNYSKEIFVKDYFDIHNFYEKIYGKKTIILMQVGSFHECYGTDSHGLGKEQIRLADHFDIICTMKDKKKPLAKNNPRMLGFPIYTIDDWTEKFLSIGYTVIVIDQTTEPPSPKREVTGVYSPTTYISKNISNKSSNLVCLYIDALNLKSNSKSPLLYIGITSYDLTTGDGYIYETKSTNSDKMFCLDDTIRFLESNPPNEVVLDFSKDFQNYMENNKINNMCINDIIAYLNLSEDQHKLYKIHNLNNIINISYQVKLLDEVFTNSNISCVDELNLQYYNNMRISLVSLLDFVKNHQNNLLIQLNKPKHYTNTNRLFLGNRALSQLDILPDPKKPKTLFDIINFTKTIIGKRYLQSMLSNPFASPDDINYNYELIELILENKLSDIISDNLIHINDLDKLIRKMKLQKINPYELFNLYNSVDSIINLLEELKNNNVFYNKIDINEEHFNILKSFIDYLGEIFEVEVLSKVNFFNNKDNPINFIRTKKYNVIFELEEAINLGENFMEHLVAKCTKIIENCGEKRFMKKNNSQLLQLKRNDQSGHYLQITNLRCKKLKEGLKKNPIKIGGKTITIDDLEFVEMPRSKNTKIYCDIMKNLSVDVTETKVKLTKELNRVFYEEINIINENFSKTLEYFSKKIAYLDFINSGSLAAFKLGYTKPCIVNNDKSFINVENVRHPIVEVINDSINYQPHSLKLGDDINGILLYGINSSGKSTLMKAIGMNLVLAQIGYYTASTKFEYYPYFNLFTRIEGNDNLFRGNSSFMVEMIELMSILKRNNNRTLVLGDEICRGTEEKSANIIVAVMLELLEESNTNFITATHLHILSELPSVKNLKTVKAMHLSVDYDTNNEMLIYNRELKEGQGEKYYGVQVAKYLMKDDFFNRRTKELENEFDNVYLKQSNYNKKNWMDCCEICKSKNNLETHHIVFQKDFINNIAVDNPHIKKNCNYNLVTLCQECHDKVDNELMIIKGWSETSNGRSLDFSLNKKKKNNKKYDENDIAIIIDFKQKGKSLKEAKKLLKEINKIDISTFTISKIWKNQYLRN